MKMTVFQIVFTGAFVGFIVLGVIAFSIFNVNSGGAGPVVIWGTQNPEAMTQLTQYLVQQDKAFQSVSYTQKPAATYIADVTDAMASGVGPDLVLLTQEQIQAFSDKLLVIPYSSISQSSFVSSYVYEGQIFLTSQGTMALPFLIDPLVLYWNRDLLTTAGYAQAPKYWDELLTSTQKLTVINNGVIKQSAIGLGGWDNIAHAKDILSALFMQAGDPIVQRAATGLVSSFGGTPLNASENPAASALQFYTEFANPSKVTYSWNRSSRNSKDMFVAGELALYVGRASDYREIYTRNPNLRFGISVLPQIQGSSVHSTYGEVTGIAIARTSLNPNGALTIAQKLTSQSAIALASQLFALPPVRIDVPADTASNAAAAVFLQSALISRGWLDPDPNATSAIFKDMVESVISNKSNPGSATQEASLSMQELVRQQGLQ